MDDLLKEAIADAKAVRETALENAKMALEEAFTPRLQNMLSQKIQNEIEDEDDENADFISCVLEWFEIDERELAVDLGRDDSGLYLEVNGHEISIEQGALQAALLYAIKEELEFV